MKSCKCIDQINDLLKKQGEHLLLSIDIRDWATRTIVATERRPTFRTRGKVTHHLVANYCPFCGKKYLDRSIGKPKKSEQSITMKPVTSAMARAIIKRSTQ